MPSRTWPAYRGADRLTRVTQVRTAGGADLTGSLTTGLARTSTERWSALEALLERVIRNRAAAGAPAAARATEHPDRAAQFAAAEAALLQPLLASLLGPARR